MWKFHFELSSCLLSHPISTTHLLKHTKMKLFIPLAFLCVLVISCQAQDPLKEKILCIIETRLSSNLCKSTSKAQAMAGSDPATACSTLETFRIMLPLVGCTTADYDLLHSIVCEHKDIPCSHAA
ncbi:uncharacterized protein LOC106062287 [Biomphalaria glabrata]|uniref:Uncharacterized protein LOC106062287 n=1 Tax=Biomphalaria glabrata TaxID=6526 RepID=A0A9U8E852_BIOGL|nr:uncharacterized protein LOC106062287 [Biomphalaria glabrata]